MKKFITALLLAAATLPAQTKSLPSGTIDGSVTPSAIPDAVAFRLFLGALAPASNSTKVTAATSVPPETPKQVAALQALRLTAADELAVISAVHSFQTAATSASAPVDIDGLSTAMMATLQAGMSASGYAALLYHVQVEKKNMKIIPVPVMNHQ
jgi:hypothetical protein